VLYWAVQGTNMFALWVLAHECGHRAFSPYTWINDVVGIVIHSALLVPFHSWRISHGNHHKHTNHIDQDTVFVPPKVSSAGAAAAREAFSESPIVSLGFIAFMFAFGWIGYLLVNVTGQKYARRANHFEPHSPLFRVHERPNIILSDLGLLVVFALLWYASSVYGLANVLCWYGVPYAVVNAWLVLVTYLHHSDRRVPKYNQTQWNFVRGAIGTIDRNYVWGLNAWVHHIHDSHVVHHLFSSMPFYNAIEVTRKHIKTILGEHYVEDQRPLAVSLWESWRSCRFVVPSEGVAYFQQ